MEILHYFSPIFSPLCLLLLLSFLSPFNSFLTMKIPFRHTFWCKCFIFQFPLFLFYLTHRILLKFSLVFWELKKHNFFSPLGVLKRIEKESWGRKADAKGVFLNMRGFFWGGPLLGWLGGSFKRTLFSIHNDESKYIWKLVTNRWSGP